MKAIILTAGLILAMGAAAEGASPGPRQHSKPYQVLPGEFASDAKLEGERATPYRSACSAGSSALLEARAKVEETARIVGTLKSDDDVPAFQKAYLELTRDRCLRGLASFTFSFHGQTPEAVKAWWTTGGERWIRSVLEMGPNPLHVILPPDLPRVADVGVLRCAAGEDCRAASAWRRRMDAKLNAATPAMPATELEQDCPIAAGREPHVRYRIWLWCASARVGKRVELPLGLYRPPTEGWLTLRFAEPHLNGTCSRIGVYSLWTGDAWEVDGCNANVSRVGRVPVEVARDLALLLALLDDVSTSARAQAHEIALPAGLQPVWNDLDDRAIIGGVTTFACGDRGPKPRLGWGVSTRGTDLSGVTYSPGAEAEQAGMLRPLTTRLLSEFRPGCLRGPTPPSASLVLQRWYHEAEAGVQQRDEDAMQALLMGPFARCD